VKFTIVALEWAATRRNRLKAGALRVAPSATISSQIFRYRPTPPISGMNGEARFAELADGVKSR
jgi:hypothetical protein